MTLRALRLLALWLLALAAQPLAAQVLPAGPVLDVTEVTAHPQTLARGMLLDTRHTTLGPMRGVGLPIHFSGQDRAAANAASRPAPLLGEHTEAVLREAGFSAEEITALQREGALLDPAASATS